jgi:hypothetical protein
VVVLADDAGTEVLAVVVVLDAESSHLEVDQQDDLESNRWAGDSFDPRLRSCLAAIYCCSLPVLEVAGMKVGPLLDFVGDSL